MQPLCELRGGNVVEEAVEVMVGILVIIEIERQRHGPAHHPMAVTQCG